jgi:DNA-directed RNA polymerase specialized sigma24 family protein
MENLEVTTEQEKVKRARNKLSAIAEQIVTAYVERKQTIVEISKFHGCSSGTVRNLLKVKGVTMRPRGRRKGQTPNSIDSD